MAELWTDKFYPKNLEEFIGNNEIVTEVDNWAKNWSEGKTGKPLLLFGQSGSGKTCLAHLIANLNDWDLFELNASDFRSKEIIERLVGAAALNSSFSGKKRLVLLDEVDGLTARDRGGAGAIVSILREAKNPVILTANNIYSNKKIAPIRVICKQLEFKKINYLSIAKRLREFLAIEKIDFDEEAIKELAKNCSGDFRSALIDLQVLSLSGKITSESIKPFGDRLRLEKIFKVMTKIFKGTELAEIRKNVFASDVPNDLLLRWIEENIPRQYSGDDIASAFEVFSRADRFNGRIMRRQHYGFLRYSGDLMTAGVALSRSKDYHSFIPFQFPTLLSKLARSTAKRELKKGLAEKIGKKTHASIKRVMSSDLPFVKMNFEDKQKAVELTAQFEFDEKEVAFLLNTTPKTKKVSTIIEQASELRKKQISTKSFPQEQFPKATEPLKSDETGEQTRLY